MIETFIDGLPAIFYPINILDVLVIGFAIYKIFDMIRGTRAEQLAKGILVLLAFSVVSELIGLSTINWVLVQLQKMLIVAIPVIFAPELRRALEQLGRGRLLKAYRKRSAREDVVAQVDQIMGCLTAASSTKTGVLIAIVRDSRLYEYSSTGTSIQGVLTTALLNNIFIVNTPLHDGAVIVDGMKIVAAGCYLPLSENRNLSKSLGTRHRAAIGLSEVSDAVVAIVSEETGSMSIAMGGKLSYDLSYRDIYQMLIDALCKDMDRVPFWEKWKVF